MEILPSPAVVWMLCIPLKTGDRSPFLRTNFRFGFENMTPNVGMGERAMELMGLRALNREAFGKAMAEHGAFASAFATCRVELSSARLTVLDAANELDRHGNKKVKWTSTCYVLV